MEAARVLEIGAESLSKKVSEYLRKRGNTISGLAKEIKYSRPTLSRYIAGTYGSDSTEVERKLVEYFYGGAKKQGNSIQIVEKSNRFFESNDARAVIGVCEASQEAGVIGIVIGRTGFGKTHSLKHYAKLPRVAYIECDDTMSIRDLVGAIERELGLPRTNSSIHERANGIKDFCNVNKGYLIIIDEADKLISKNTIKKMEILRAIYDQSEVAIVLAGELKLEILLKNYDERLSNRITFYARLGGLTEPEVEQYLGVYDITADAINVLKARACGTRNGCFRLLDRTLSNVIRLLNKSGEKHITEKWIEKGTALMMQ